MLVSLTSIEKQVVNKIKSQKRFGKQDFVRLDFKYHDHHSDPEQGQKQYLVRLPISKSFKVTLEKLTVAHQ